MGAARYFRGTFRENDGMYRRVLCEAQFSLRTLSRDLEDDVSAVPFGLVLNEGRGSKLKDSATVPFIPNPRLPLAWSAT
jgi:hypothetical protein